MEVTANACKLGTADNVKRASNHSHLNRLLAGCLIFMSRFLLLLHETECNPIALRHPPFGGTTLTARLALRLLRSTIVPCAIPENDRPRDHDGLQDAATAPDGEAIGVPNPETPLSELPEAMPG
jgi:hypothetical protein